MAVIVVGTVVAPVQVQVLAVPILPDLGPVLETPEAADQNQAAAERQILEAQPDREPAQATRIQLGGTGNSAADRH